MTKRTPPGSAWRIIHRERPGCERGPVHELRSADFEDGPMTASDRCQRMDVRTVVERFQVGAWLDVELYDGGYLVRLGQMEFVEHEGRRGKVTVRPVRR